MLQLFQKLEKHDNNRTELNLELFTCKFKSPKIKFKVKMSKENKTYINKYRSTNKAMYINGIIITLIAPLTIQIHH
jgi:hypothetical protein